MPHTLVRCVAGSYVVGWTDDGRGFAPIGPKFPDPRSAVRYADALEAMPVVHPVPRRAADLARVTGVPGSQGQPLPEARDASPRALPEGTGTSSPVPHKPGLSPG